MGKRLFDLIRLRSWPGFRSGVLWKKAIALFGYGLIGLFLIGGLGGSKFGLVTAFVGIALTVLISNLAGVRGRVPLIGSASRVLAGVGWVVVVLVAFTSMGMAAALEPASPRAAVAPKAELGLIGNPASSTNAATTAPQVPAPTATNPPATSSPASIATVSPSPTATAAPASVPPTATQAPTAPPAATAAPATAAPTTARTQAPTPSPAPATAAPATVTFTSVKSPVAAGSTGFVSVSTRAGATCTITVTYKSGTSSAQGLGQKTADGAGAVSWTWVVGANTTSGTWPIDVRCAGVNARTTFVVQ